MIKQTVCFFSTSDYKTLLKEQYSIQDIKILKELGYSVTTASKFFEIPWNCDFYFSWWASGSILPFIVAFLRQKPIIVIAGGNEAMYYRDSVSGKAKGYLATKWYKKIATRITLRFSNRILVVSKFMLADVKKLGAKNPILVYNSVDTKKFIPKHTERTEIISIFKLDLDVVELKRGFVLIEAISLVLQKKPNQIFTMIGGHGNAYSKMVEKCKEFGIEDQVRFINEIPNEEVIEWMRKSILYIQISDTETFGVSIAEAMSCETPVLVSKRGAIPEVTGDLGIFVNHNSPEEVSIGILKILEMNNEDRISLGKRLRRRIQANFSFDGRKNELKKIIDSILI